MTKFEKKLVAAGIKPVNTPKLDEMFDFYRNNEREAGREPMNYRAWLASCA